MSTYKASDYFIMRIDTFRSGIRLYEISGPYETREKAEDDFNFALHTKEKFEIWSLPDLQRAKNAGMDVNMVGEL